MSEKPRVSCRHLWTDVEGISHQKRCAMTEFELKSIEQPPMAGQGEERGRDGHSYRYAGRLDRHMAFFDLITFYVLQYLFGAGEALFQTGWFIESITAQVLVVFAIRTRRPIFRSGPHLFLAAMALGVVSVATALPMFPVFRKFHR